MLHLDARQRAMLRAMGLRIPRLRVPHDPVETVPDVAVRSPRPEIVREEALAAPQSAAPSADLAPVADGILPPGIATMDWPALEQAVATCRACGLCNSRTRTVFGVGARDADWMVVGEAPGRNEDLRGEPFVGQAGKLLDNMLAAMGLSRRAGVGAEAEDQGRGGVYITNVVKCRPPGNRNPSPEEVSQCEHYLQRQVALVRPRIILAMGRFAVQALLGTSEPIGRLRGRVHSYAGTPVVVSYHPAYLLRTPAHKARAWQDLQLALRVHAGALQQAPLEPGAAGPDRGSSGTVV